MLKAIAGMLSLIYITRAQALAFGFTHEGTLFGVPAWMRDGDSVHDCYACPKVPVLQAWALFADSLYEFASWFMWEDQSLQTPIHIIGPIKPGPGVMQC